MGFIHNDFPQFVSSQDLSSPVKVLNSTRPSFKFLVCPHRGSYILDFPPSLLHLEHPVCEISNFPRLAFPMLVPIRVKISFSLRASATTFALPRCRGGARGSDGEAYDKVFNHLDLLNAPLEGKIRFEDVQDVQVLKLKTKLIVQEKKIAED
ncbi:hypothetical protein Tco_1445113 [Tanacetum coccineum]